MASNNQPKKTSAANKKRAAGISARKLKDAEDDEGNVFSKNGAQAKLTRGKKDLLLAEIRRTGNTAAAARLIGITPTRIYHLTSPNHADYDMGFAQEVKDAKEEWIADLEQEAQQRARGRDELVIQGGRVVTHKGKPLTVRKASDLLMMFVLKAQKPEVYHDAVRLAGHDGGPVGPSVDPRAALLAKLGSDAVSPTAATETGKRSSAEKKHAPPSASSKKRVTPQSLREGKKRRAR